MARTLVDTSAWIDALRRDGDERIGAAVRELTADGEAVFCDLVLLELWNGAGGDAETRLLAELERELECVPTTPEVLGGALGGWPRTRAQWDSPSLRPILLIAACALEHVASISFITIPTSIVLRDEPSVAEAGRDVDMKTVSASASASSARAS